MRLILPFIIALLLPLRCFGELSPAASPQAIIAGEVVNPGRFELAKAATLSAIFSEITKPFAMGAKSRIRIYRNGKFQTYDLKEFGAVTLNGGDVIEVPIKYVYEGQGEVQDRVATAFCADTKEFLGRIAMLKSDLWTVHANWREGIEGVEFRPTGTIGEHGGISVFVRAARATELAPIVNPTGEEPSKRSQAVLLFCRDFRTGIVLKTPSEFETTLVARIQALPSNAGR